MFVQRDERARRVEEAQRVMRRIGSQLIEEKKRAIRSEKTETTSAINHRGRDLLALLIKANMSTDIPESQRLSDKDVLART